jgi:hypothetical protein
MPLADILEPLASPTQSRSSERQLWLEQPELPSDIEVNYFELYLCCRKYIMMSLCIQANLGNPVGDYHAEDNEIGNEEFEEV